MREGRTNGWIRTGRKRFRRQRVLSVTKQVQQLVLNDYVLPEPVSRTQDKQVMYLIPQ